jgi:transcriptional regulator with XRE-family HTH domain
MRRATLTVGHVAFAAHVAARKKAEGLTDGAVARRFGVTPQAVANWLRLERITTPNNYDTRAAIQRWTQEAPQYGVVQMQDWSIPAETSRRSNRPAA